MHDDATPLAVDAPGAIGARLARALLGCLGRQPEPLRSHPDLVDFDAASAAEALRDDTPDALALASLARGLVLAPAEHAAALLALRCETDMRLAAVLEQLQGGDQAPGPARPTPGLLVTLLAETADASATPHPSAATTMARLVQGPALACGLLQMADAPSLPLSRRVLQMPLPLVTLLCAGAPAAVTRLHRLLLRRLPVPHWPLPASWRARLQPMWTCPAPAAVIVLRGSDAMADLEAAAQALAGAWGLQALRVEAEEGELAASTLQAHAVRAGLAPLLQAASAVAVWHAPAGPGTLRVPMLEGVHTPWIVLAPAEVSVQADAGRLLREVELPLPGPLERLALWTALVPGDTDRASLDAVRDSRCGLSVLLRAADQAQAAARGPAQAEALSRSGAAANSATSGTSATALHAAVRAAARDLSAWAQVSTDTVPLDTWVGQEDIRAALDLLLQRCTAREATAQGLGPMLAGRVLAGVKALFVGASGTGKTLAAQWLADRLARPLVRVDLGAVVSKYIGETEKNLGALLARAEHVDAVLLFDEADALFGARTDVRQANDRYANMQTNYLLQRLETFSGLAILTSNSRARFDEAFIRRLDTTIEFPLPDAAQRLRLWDLHLGVREDEPLPLQALRRRVAALADLPGGHIRNVALTAALLARARAGGDAAPEGAAHSTAPPPPVTAADLSQALVLEYRKLGLRLPEALLQPD